MSVVAQARAFEVLATDLSVVPNMISHDAASEDLTTRRTARGIDLATLSGRENLAQALILRILTPMGALAPLGHPTYGSRLSRLIGHNKTEALRNLCRAYVLEAVAQEPRVEPKAVSFDFDRAAERSDSFAFVLAVRPIAGGNPLAVSLEVSV
jgi:phage baseplate assembly protein W